MDAKMKAMKGSMGMMGGQQGKYAGAMKDNMPADMGARL